MATSPPSIAACAVILKNSEGLHLIPAGKFNGNASKGSGPWVLDATAAMKLILAAQARGTKIPIDYEHQTLHSDSNGQPAPAAGWIDPEGLTWDPARGLVANSVRWTERASVMLAAGEYQYISPVFSYDKSTGVVLELLHAALTNVPALTQLDPVTLQAAAARYYRPEEDLKTMNEEQLAALRKALGLADAADADAVLVALSKLKAASDTAAASLGSANEQLAALKAASPDPAKFVPVGVLDEMQTELAALKVANTEREVSDLVDAALSGGRILPAMEGWARNLGKSHLAALRSYLDVAAPIAALKGSQTEGKDPGGHVADPDPVKTAETKWASSAALREEFNDRDAYVAYAKASAQGRVHINQQPEAK
jgi:phage I-like protein